MGIAASSSMDNAVQDAGNLTSEDQDEYRFGSIWVVFYIRVPFYKGAVLCGGPKKGPSFRELPIWVVVKIMVPLWVLIIIRHLIFRVPKKGPYF